MKSRLGFALALTFFAAFSAMIGGVSAAHADEPPSVSLPSVSVFSPDPVCNPAQSVTIHTVMEFQDGLFAWRPVGNWEICVNNGGTSQITVNFKDETYQAIITINGYQESMAPPANGGWAFEFTRQDLMGGVNYSPARESSFVLDQSHRHRFELGGHFYDQTRNLRFTVSY